MGSAYECVMDVSANVEQDFKRLNIQMENITRDMM